MQFYIGESRAKGTRARYKARVEELCEFWGCKPREFTTSELAVFLVFLGNMGRGGTVESTLAAVAACATRRCVPWGCAS